MIYRFGAIRFDTDRRELTSGDLPVPVEPQVFDLLQLLIENRDRLISKDEILEKIWHGRIVSEAAISSRVKSARQAIGDDGRDQRLIRTHPKHGFRFVGAVEPWAAEAAVAAPPAPEPSAGLAGRPAIAVLPFTAIGDGPASRAMAEALPHDLIAELSRLRWLFVIARGSSFRFRGPAIDFGEVREALQVGYCLTGSVEVDAAALSLTVELCETQSGGGVIWSERFRTGTGAVHEIRQEIVQAVIAALELQIPLVEARRARLKSPDSLDAWSAFHLGVSDLFRFAPEANARAARLFERALELEPGFARAHAGLSFAHFENAFLRFVDDAPRSAELARRSAESGLEHDPLDPFCNLVMGRSFWLADELDASLPWLDRAMALNPNYAQARYARAWTETLIGDGRQGQADVDSALALSPLDPLAYGMLGVRAFSHIVLDEPGEAAAWAERAARAPGAHALIEMIAAISHVLAGDRDRARRWADSARTRHAGLGPEDFLRAFPFRDPSARARIARAFGELKP
jgi:TolB-like protein